MARPRMRMKMRQHGAMEDRVEAMALMRMAMVDAITMQSIVCVLRSNVALLE